MSKGNITRINIPELKALIFREIGYERANLYFDMLNRYLNSKISKIDFSKLCIQTLKRENLSLHDLLIRSILKNASVPKPQQPKTTKLPNGPLASNLINRYKTKRRSQFSRPSKFRAQPSPLGPLGKTTSSAVDQSTTELNSLGSRLCPILVEEGEEVEQISVVGGRKSILPPLGVMFNLGGDLKKKNPLEDSMTCQSSGGLPDATALKGRIEQRLLFDGVGVSEDCVNLLNSGINVFLKRLIGPGLGFARSRSGCCKNLSMLDFRALVESNPKILGEDWSIQLEKICYRAYEKWK